MLTMAPACLTVMQIVNSLLLILISFGIILALAIGCATLALGPGSIPAIIEFEDE